MQDLSLNSKKIVHNTGALYFRMFVTMIVTFFTARITLNILGVDNYGLNNLVGGVISMFSFLNLSIGTSLQRFYSFEIGKRSKEGLKRVFGNGLFLHLIISIITLIIGLVFSLFFLNKLNIPPERIFAAHVVFQVSIVSLIIQVMIVPYTAFLRANEEFARMAYIEIIQVLLRLIILYFLINIEYDKLIVYSLLNLIITIIYFILIFILARRYEETIFQLLRDKHLIKDLIHFSAMIVLTTFSQLFRDKGIIIIINIFFGLAINAAYAVAVQISNMIDSFTLSFKQSIVPQLMSSFAENNINRTLSIIYTGTKIMFLLLLLVTLPLIFETKYILDIWFVTPPKYTAGFTILLLVNAMIYSFSYFLTQGIHASGMINKLQILTSVFLIMNIGIVFILIKLGFSFYSIVYVNIGISIILNLINIMIAKSVIGLNVKYYISSIIGKCLLISLLVSFVLLIINYYIDPSIHRLVITLSVSSVLIFIFGYFFGLNNFEKKIINNIVLIYVKKFKITIKNQ